MNWDVLLIILHMSRCFQSSFGVIIYLQLFEGVMNFFKFPFYAFEEIARSICFFL